MAQEQPETITCPSCGNVNPYMADECERCGLALGSIREALAKPRAPTAHKAPPAGEPRAEGEIATSSLLMPSISPPLPAPAIPRTRTETTGDLGYLYAGSLTLIRGMADRIGEVRRLFFERSEARGISGASYSPGQLMVEGQTRDYQFAERDLGSSAKATIGVRIADIGTDLYAEWRHYVLPPKEFSFPLFLLVGGIVFMVACGLIGLIGGGIGQLSENAGVGTICLAPLLAVLPAALVGVWVGNQSRGIALKGFQTQDSDTFQLAIRAALEEAIDMTGIAKELRTETRYESQLPERRRLI